VAAHEAARNFLHLDLESDLDVNERYFWALSLGSHPQQQVIKGEAPHTKFVMVQINEVELI
jgi:hypothetical protein